MTTLTESTLDSNRIPCDKPIELLPMARPDPVPPELAETDSPLDTKDSHAELIRPIDDPATGRKLLLPKNYLKLNPDEQRTFFKNVTEEVAALKEEIKMLQSGAIPLADAYAGSVRNIDFLPRLVPRQLSQFKRHTGKVLGLACVPGDCANEYGMLSIGLDGMAMAWDLKTGLRYEAIRVSSGHTMSLAGNPSGRLMSVGGLACTVDLYAIGERLHDMLGHPRSRYVFDLDMSNSDSTERVVDWTAEGHVPDRGFSSERTNPKSPLREIRQKVFPQRYGVFNQPLPQYVDVNGAGLYRTTLFGHQGAINSQCFLDESELITGATDKTVKLWDIPHGVALSTYNSHSGAVNNVGAVPGRMHLFYSAGEDGQLNFWDSRTSDKILSFQALDNDGFVSASFHPEGQCIAAAEPKGLSLFDLRSNQRLFDVQNTRSDITSVALSSSGRLAVLGHAGNSFAVFDTLKSQWVCVHRAHTRDVSAVAVVGDRIVTASHDTSIRIWTLHAVPGKGGRDSSAMSPTSPVTPLSPTSVRGGRA